MRPFLLSGSAVADWLAVGVAPMNSNAPSNVEPMGVMESYLLVGVLGLACWGSFRLVMWLDVKIGTHALLRKLDRELGVGYGPGRPGSHLRRQP